MQNSNMSLSVKLEPDKTKSFAIVCILYYPLINAGVVSLFSGFSIPGLGFAYPILIAFEFVAIYGALIYDIKKTSIPLFFAYVSIIILYTATDLFFPDNEVVLLGTIRNLFLFCIPAFALAFTLYDYSHFWDYLKKFSYISVICGVLYILFYQGQDAEYSMWLGYQLTIPTMMLLWSLFQTPNRFILDILFFITGCISIVARGSRGPVLILLLYFIVCAINYKLVATDDDLTKRKTIKIGNRNYYLLGLFLLIGIVVAVIYLLANLTIITGQLYDLFNGFGYDSRTLRVLSMQDALTYTAGRDDYFNVSIQLIKQRPIIGYGIAGDCVQIGRAFHADELLFPGMYAHNVLLEMLLHFGVFIGTLAFVSYVYVIIKKVKGTKHGSINQSVMILFCVLVGVQSMVSANYLVLVSFWMLLGMSLAKKRNEE